MRKKQQQQQQHPQSNTRIAFCFIDDKKTNITLHKTGFLPTKLGVSPLQRTLKLVCIIVIKISVIEDEKFVDETNVFVFSGRFDRLRVEKMIFFLF